MPRPFSIGLGLVSFSTVVFVGFGSPNPLPEDAVMEKDFFDATYSIIKKDTNETIAKLTGDCSQSRDPDELYRPVTLEYYSVKNMAWQTTSFYMTSNNTETKASHSGLAPWGLLCEGNRYEALSADKVLKKLADILLEAGISYDDMGLHARSPLQTLLPNNKLTGFFLD